MESELSGIFRVKLVTKNIARGSPGTQFMHMRVNNLFISYLSLFISLIKLKNIQMNTCVILK